MSQTGTTENGVIRDDGPVTARDGQHPRAGRKRDLTRDAAILDAALEVLAEVGYAGMTMDMVAVRAKAGKATVYRRWSSKADLVLDAVTHLKRGQVDLDRLPDTGTLRGDLVGLIRPKTIEEERQRLRVMVGLASVLSHDAGLADAVNAAIHEPWVEVNCLLMRRAIDRGEISASVDVETLSLVIPSMAAFRMLIQRKPVDREFLVSLIDGLLLPALRPD